MTACCPRCSTRLSGGPVQYWCGACRRALFAADLSTEYTPPTLVKTGAGQ